VRDRVSKLVLCVQALQELKVSFSKLNLMRESLLKDQTNPTIEQFAEAVERHLQTENI
jgi:hypothetical protein